MCFRDIQSRHRWTTCPLALIWLFLGLGITYAFWAMLEGIAPGVGTVFAGGCPQCLLLIWLCTWCKIHTKEILSDDTPLALRRWGDHKYKSPLVNVMDPEFKNSCVYVSTIDIPALTLPLTLGLLVSLRQEDV